ncbi:phage baseplate assembly protein V [Pigmentiphaga sp. CHJ604]|uniref:phage baseplate assembly protein V n=1 Tax=Pigmentiphaga sp. CHJ604 TaxID=3081984 RepID=UPI0030D176A3
MPPTPTNIAEILRLLQNLIRFGSVADIQYGDHMQPPRVRVAVGGILTNWVPWVAPRASGTSEWDPPSVGEQTILLSPGGDLAAGAALPAIYSDTNAPPSRSPSEHVRRYPDGAVLSYDHASHALNVQLPAGGTANLIAPAKVTVQSAVIELDAAQTTITGACTVKGLLTYQAGMAGRPGSTGAAASIQGTIRVNDGDVIADGVSLVNHPHGGVSRGGDDTDPPQATEA